MLSSSPETELSEISVQILTSIIRVRPEEPAPCSVLLIIHRLPGTGDPKT